VFPQDYIEAIAAFFEHSDVANYTVRVLRYEASMREIYYKYQENDLEVSSEPTVLLRELNIFCPISPYLDLRTCAIWYTLSPLFYFLVWVYFWSPGFRTVGREFFSAVNFVRAFVLIRV
jgi:hypothetical protein